MDLYIRDFKDHQPIKSLDIEDIDILNNHIVPNSSFSILQLNIRSINQNFDGFRCLLDLVGFDFDIIVLSETHHIHNENFFQIRGYNMMYSGGTVNKCDGVVVFIKDTITQHYKFEFIGQVKSIEIEITNVFKDTLLITSIYRSPSLKKDQFNIDFAQYLDRKKYIKNHVITGDINIDLKSLKSDDEEYKNIISSYNFKSYINGVTRPDSGTCLDHFLVKMCNEGLTKVPKSFILKYDLTDHYPIVLNLNLEKEINITHEIQTKKFIEYGALRDDLTMEEWQPMYSTENIEIATNNFINILTNCINKHTKIIRTSNRRNGKNKWITKNLLKRIQIKNRLYLQSKKEPHNLELKERYKAYNNEINKLIKKTKKDFVHGVIVNNVNQNKVLWNCVNEICGGNNRTKQNGIESIKLANDDLLKNELDIANHLNEHFSEIGQKLASEIRETTQNTVKLNNRSDCQQSMFLSETTPIEVLHTIDNLKKGKSPGVDGIRSETLKEIKNEISHHLAYLINLSFEAGTFPEALKIGMVTPLYKNGSRDDVNNYRPISLISNIAKVFEKILKVRMVSFLTRYSLLSDKQFGFRDKRSTEDAIVKLTSYLYEHLDKSRPSLCIFVDLSKAFDTVNHNILLDKLHSYGIRGVVHNLIKSYLTNRRQSVVVNKVQSSFQNVTCGVPQGTVLGPLLFVIYVNDLLRMNSVGEVISYADDTAIFYSSDGWNSLKRKAEEDLRKITNWFQINKLSLNASKTKYLTFTSYARDLPNMGSLNVSGDISIPEVASIKYLGLTLDRHLRWDLHAKEVTSKMRGLISKFRRLKEFLDIEHLKTLYYALVQSHLCYGLSGWGGIRDCHMYSIEVVQKWILKVVYEKNRIFPSDQLYNITGIFDLRQLYVHKLLLNLHKQKISIDYVNHMYDTRAQNRNVSMPRSEKSIGQRYCKYYIAKIYNILPENIKEKIRHGSFKSLIKIWIRQTGRGALNALINNA